MYIRRPQPLGGGLLNIIFALVRTTLNYEVRVKRSTMSQQDRVAAITVKDSDRNLLRNSCGAAPSDIEGIRAFPSALRLTQYSSHPP